MKYNRAIVATIVALSAAFAVGRAQKPPKPVNTHCWYGKQCGHYSSKSSCEARPRNGPCTEAPAHYTCPACLAEKD